MIFLDVPFREKDQAKQLGARWDGASKKWYIPADLTESVDDFQKWLPQKNNLNPPDQQAFFSDSSSHEATSTKTNTKEKGVALSSLLRNVQGALYQAFPGAVWVMAEIANLNNNRGHIYLELTESNAQGKNIANCRAMIWQRQATALLQRFESETGSPLSIGQKVLLLVEVSFHEQYGFSIVIQDIDSSYTLGALERNLSELRKQLILEKSYDKNKRFTLPSDFFRVAIIAPPDAAGLGDFRADADCLQSQNLCGFHYFYSAFQGDAVQKEMQIAFDAVHALHKSNPFDALVMIRGGGAKLDLHTLNTYSLAKLLCDATLPIITGIGHERDNTILDEVANRHFDTPSKVIGYIRHEIVQQAQLAQANWNKIEHTSLLCVKQLEQILEHLNQNIQHQSQQALFGWKQRIEPLNSEVQRLSESQIQTKQHHLNDLMASIEMQSNNRITLKKQMLEQQYGKVKEGGERAILQKKQQIQQWIAHILSSGPKTQLNRGFNLAKDPNNNKPVTRAKDALAVKYLQLEFIDGVVSAHIEKEIDVTRNKL